MALRTPDRNQEVAPARPPIRRWLSVDRHTLWLLVLLTAVFFVLIAVRFLVAPLDRFDEGVTLLKADLAAAGWVPYRDFWITYGPLDTYLLAGAFKLFGASVLVERAMGIVLAWAFSLVAYRLMASVGLRRGLRILMTGLIGLVPVSVAAFNSSFLVNLIGLCALLAFLHSVKNNEWRWPAIAGVLTGVASFSRPEFAASLAVGLLAGYIVLVLRGRRASRKNPLPYAAASLLTASILWAPTLIAAGIQPMVNQLFVYAVRLYPMARSIPIGQGTDGPAVIVFACGFALVWIWGAVHLYRHRTEPDEVARVLALLLTGLLIFTWVRTRADGAHALNAWPPTAVLLAMLMQPRASTIRLRPRFDAVMAVAGCLLLLAGVSALAYRDLSRSTGSGSQLDRAQLVGDSSWMPEGQLAALVARVDQAVPAGRPIFIGLRRNDQGLFNDAMLYFLTARRPGTVYFEFLPGFSSSEGVQRTVACQLQASGTALAVLGPNSAGEPWNASARTGSSYLDEWLLQHSVQAAEVNGYELLQLDLPEGRPGPASWGACGLAPE